MYKGLILFFTVIAFVFADDNNNVHINSLKERYAVTIHNNKDIKKIVGEGIELDCATCRNNELQVYATPYQVNLLKNKGYKVVANPVIIGKNTRDASYHTYATLTAELQKLANDYSDIAQLHTIGKSVEGRELWIIKISDNVEQNEAEPEFKYISSMHGDEVVGKEMMMYLINELLTNYGKRDDITRLINETQIWIMPSMNPDGTEAQRRYNADWVDLNRNFPDLEDDKKNTPDGRATETQLMMRFNEEHNFVLSINFHGGALVVNYPWDTKSGDAPYIELVKYLSLGYSSRNKPMYENGSFPQGIVNGYNWYEINGGMQDWNYHWYGTLELTLEVSDVKWPNADKLAGYWADNKESLLWYMSQTHKGIKGTVRDAATGEKLRASVSVTGLNSTIKSGALHGDYYRVLLPGTYDLRFSAPGYQSKTVRGVKVQEGEFAATVLDIELTKE
ncbi:DUF2817 domain-containing protein [Candidatus Uabimicrobium amorphum]|uniref:Carboxypeptidase T n=1 Tax=Uabimicrobium amorphum TaxID=2596890 RepID=A0A5S9F6C8_UABAM|nr:DUF2817 domain-containing protein [Candidatus Uabimicrobium amorphum]BBM87756.1 carboxypeptidase T [Candidatus Uabimicrobium amorphum]